MCICCSSQMIRAVGCFPVVLSESRRVRILQRCLLIFCLVSLPTKLCRCCRLCCLYAVDFIHMTKYVIVIILP